VRIAFVSDIHGNRTAFEAVLADLRETSPDLVLHGGDLADSGSSPTEIVDRIRDLGWNGLLGNTDEMHSRPESLEEFASQSSAPPSLSGPQSVRWQLRVMQCSAKRGLHGWARFPAS
jgi:predicted phosphodiesterase